MSAKDVSGSAFPSEQEFVSFNHYQPLRRVLHAGMTLRQYAAIKLRVPDSGTPWLDEMISAARQDYFAAKADIPWEKAFEHAQDHLAAEGTYLGEIPIEEILKSRAILRYIDADAMIKARQP